MGEKKLGMDRQSSPPILVSEPQFPCLYLGQGNLTSTS